MKTHALIDATLGSLLRQLDDQRPTLVRRAARGLESDDTDMVLVLDVRVSVSSHSAITDMVIPDGDHGTRMLLSRVLPPPPSE